MITLLPEKMVQVFHWNHLSFVITSTFFFSISYLLVHPYVEQEPIDVVYTWVNGSDPRFLSQLEKFLQQVPRTTVDSSGTRFDDKGELKFSLRSLERYAPWVNHVYIVTNGQIPHWLNMDYEGVTVVTHDDIFVDKKNLPTFSSPAHLHRIPGLSKRFIYFNDDFFLRSPVYLEDFVTSGGESVIYLSDPIHKTAPHCSWNSFDDVCNKLNCQMDDDWEDSASNYERILFACNPNVYRASLQHTNLILNDYYGRFTLRNVPAHAPIMIDKEVMEEMQKKFERYFRKTARNRIRNVDDMQLAFSYYYYLIHEKRGYKIISDADSRFVDFENLHSDVENVVKQLETIRRSTKKFVCLNDDLDQNWTHAKKHITELMLQLYVSLFPSPSRFELPEGRRNPFLYLEDYATAPS